MIGNTSNTHTTTAGAIENVRQITMHLDSNLIIQKRTPIFRAEDQMHKNIREGLRHGSEYNAGLQPANIDFTMTWGVAPGYDSAGLQPAAQQ